MANKIENKKPATKAVAKRTTTKKSSTKKAPAKRTTKKTISRKYEGASKSKRLSRWNASSTSANSETYGGLITLRDRARDLRRNNPYASRGVQVIASNVVGTGIVTHFRDNGDAVESVNEAWKKWAHTTAIDYDGLHDIFGIEKLIMEAVVESGEVLIRRRIDSSKAFPLQYQVLESDFIDTHKNEETSNGVIIQGIEYENGKRVAYYLFENHPGGGDTTKLKLKTNRVPADEIIHVFRVDRPGQVRGITWLAPIMIRLKDLDEYEDANLLRQKIAACFTAFVRDLSSDITDQDEDCGDDLSDRLEPGAIEHLPSGKTVEFPNPPQVQGYKEFVGTLLHAVAVGLGVTYEALTSDLSEVNFSSGRMGWIEFQRNIVSWRRDLLGVKFLSKVVEDFKKFLTLSGTVYPKTMTAVHIPPRREMIDPTKETAASIESIKGGLSSLSEELMALGKDPIEHLNQYKKDMDLLDKLDIKLASDARLDNQNQNGVINANN